MISLYYKCYSALDIGADAAPADLIPPEGIHISEMFKKRNVNTAHRRRRKHAANDGIIEFLQLP